MLTLITKQVSIPARVALLALMAVSAACTGEHGSQSNIATAAALTTSYGTETQAAIENFYLQWFSLDAIKDPSIQARVATGRHLDYWGNARMGQAIYDEPFWLITKSVVIDGLQVLDHTPERFKAIAHVTRLEDKIKPHGEIVESTFTHKSCGVYVFVREVGVWKLATYFDMSISRDVERDWRDAPDWSKQLIGDLPRNACD